MGQKHDRGRCATCQEFAALTDYGWNWRDVMRALGKSKDALDKHLRTYAPDLLPVMYR